MLENQLKEKYNLHVIGGTKEIWKVAASTSSRNCKNYVRSIISSLQLNPNPEKSVIALSLGDPTVYGNLPPSAESVQAVIEALESGAFNGYAPTVGYDEARQAIADYLSFDGVKFETKDVLITSSCSSALEICVTALADGARNHNILLPRPGFPICRTIAESIGVQVKYYNLLPEKSWEVDLDHLESQIDENTAAILINNPSNPCGSVFSEEHIRNIIDIAYRRKIPIIADEIYERIVFPGRKFVSFASVNCGVPILICGGLSKRFLVPGWRFGWIVVQDEPGAFEHIRDAIVALSGRTNNTSSLIQGALPRILKNTPQSFYDNLIRVLARNASVAYNTLQDAKGLSMVYPEGAMYMLVEIHVNKFPEFSSGLDFVTKLMEEESVFCLPGECFEIEGFMRIVLTLPEDILLEACNRIVEFCFRHYK